MNELEELKSRLVLEPIMIVLDWNESFEIMCVASDIAIRAILVLVMGLSYIFLYLY